MSGMDAQTAYVVTVWRSFEALQSRLLETADPSIIVDAQAVYSKAMILAAGNWFERKVSEVLVDFARVHSNGDLRVVELVRQRAVARQFHTLFDWEQQVPSRFLALFGDRFKDASIREIKASETLASGARDFMTLVAQRNALAHAQALDEEPPFTAAEVFTKFNSGAEWVRWLERALLAPVQA